MNEKIEHMKYLKIENNKAFFIKDKNQPNSWTAIDQIGKEYLLKLLEYEICEDCELDEYDENNLSNKTTQII